MAQDGWGAPRIHAELTKLGFVVSEMTVSRYLPRLQSESDQVKRWIAFLRNTVSTAKTLRPLVVRINNDEGQPF